MTGKDLATVPKIDNREAWLTAASNLMTAWFQAIDETVPSIRISVGWPGARANKKTTRGQCWASSAATDKVSQIFISPMQADTVTTLGVLLHEMVHAVDDCKDGHKGNFARIAKKLGFSGKLTDSSDRTDELTQDLTVLAQSLGPFPSAALSEGGGVESPKKQGTRMIKLEAKCCGYIARTTRKWLEIGTPSCPCGNEMQEAS